MRSNFDYEVKEEPKAMDGEIYGFEDESLSRIKEDDKFNSNSCWNRFKVGVRGLWATKHTENTKENRQLYIRTTVRELLIYILFLIIMMIISFGMTTVQGYWFTNILNPLFMAAQYNDNSGSFSNMATEADFWKFLTGPLINGLYWTTWYNNINASENQMNFLYYENKLIGLPRIRQLRVSNNSCNVNANFRSEIKQCFAAYSTNTESKEPFGLQTPTAWTYSSEAVTQGGTYEGNIATYGGGGFYVDLANNQADSINIIKKLFDSLWIDRGTRAVIMEFTIYNANINLFCMVKLVAEFPATGGVTTNNEFRTVKLIRYVAPLDYFILSCEIIFLIFIIYYAIEEILEIKVLKLEYFFSIWNILDIMVIIFSISCTIFNIYQTITVQKVIGDLISNDNRYANFESLTFWQLQFNYLIAITLFLAWIKIFKYISFNKTMTQLSATLDRCSKDLAGFAIMFFIIFLAFAQLGYLIFGAQLEDFNQLQNAIFTLFRIILGDFDFTQLEMAHRVLGPLYFVFYVFFVFFVLFNMFLAIINDTYSQVKEELAKQKNEFEIADYLKERAENFLEKLHIKRDKIIDLQNAMMSADANNDGVMDFEEWKTELKMRGYLDEEIESVFARYDTDGDRVLDMNEQISMQKELEDRKAALNNEILLEKSEILNKQTGFKEIASQSVSIEDYRALNKRVDRLDNSTRGIVSRIETVLDGLENMEKTSASNRETMGVILKTLISMDDRNDEGKKAKLESLIQNEINKLSQNSLRRPQSENGSGNLDRD